MATTQTSNFETIYSIISKSDFTGLISGSTAIKKFSDETTASTKTVQDLTQVVDAGIGGVKAYLGAYDEGFTSISNRFSELSKNGASATGVLHLIGGTLKDVVDTSLKQSAVGFELLGNLLSVDMVKGAVAFGVATVAISAALGAVGKGFYDATTAAIVYTRGLETTKVMMNATTGASYALTSSLVDSANRASWDRVGKSWSGYINFFVGIGKASTAVKGYVVDAGTRLLEWGTSSGGLLDRLGNKFAAFGEYVASNLTSLKDLKLSISDVGTSIKDIQGLNDQFNKIASSMGVGSDEVRKYFETLKTQTRDGVSALNILQIAGQGALKNENFRQNIGEIINDLVALKTGAEAPVASLIKLGIAVKDSAGNVASNVELLTRFKNKLLEMGAPAEAVAAAIDNIAKGGPETQQYEQRINRLRAFNQLVLKEELSAAIEARDRVAALNIPELTDRLNREIFQLRKRSIEEINTYELRSQIDQNRRVEIIRGNELQVVENNAALERQIITNKFAATVKGTEEEKALQEDFKNVEYKIYQDRISAAQKHFDAQVSLASAGVEALKNVQGAGATTDDASLRIIEQQRDQTISRFKEVNKGNALDLRQQQELLRFDSQRLAFVRDRRAEVINEITAGIQTVSQLQAQGGGSGADEIRNAKELAQVRIEGIQAELNSTQHSAGARLALLKEQASVEINLRDTITAKYKEMGTVAANVTKQSISDLNTQRINADRLLSSAATNKDVINVSQATRSAQAAADPRDVASVIFKAMQEEQVAALEKTLAPAIEKFTNAVKANPNDKSELALKAVAELTSGKSTKDAAVIRTIIGDAFQKAIDSTRPKTEGSGAYDPAQTQREIASIIKTLQIQNKDLTEEFKKSQEIVGAAAEKLVNSKLDAAEQFKKLSETAFKDYQSALEVLKSDTRAIILDMVTSLSSPVTDAVKLVSTSMGTGGTDLQAKILAAADGFVARVNGTPLETSGISNNSAVIQRLEEVKNMATELVKAQGANRATMLGPTKAELLETLTAFELTKSSNNAPENAPVIQQAPEPPGYIDSVMRKLDNLLQHANQRVDNDAIVNATVNKLTDQL